MCDLRNCIISGNTAFQGDGGGTVGGNLRNCALTGNRSPLSGSGAYFGTLLNCTVTGNTSGGYGNYGGAVAAANLTNCIVYGNFNLGAGVTNYASDCAFGYCVTYPSPPGVGNLEVDPQLLPDGIHVAETSPCRGIGFSNVPPGTDIDDQVWRNPPSIGCDEWQPEPLVTTPASFEVASPTRTLVFDVGTAGQLPLSFFWFKNGSLIQDGPRVDSSSTANLRVSSFDTEDAGAYYVVVTNLVGVVTSEVAQVVIHCVDAAGGNSTPPYSSWASAATNIQQAVDVASAGAIVLVTNGVYASGGKTMAGVLTNRVALDKPITVLSINGAAHTVIEGGWDPVSTNGPAAVRCVWLADGAYLAGFTLRNGATLSSGDLSQRSGGGVWSASSNAIVSNCILTNNSAVNGGGVAYGVVRNSILTANAAVLGGGAYQALMNNCTVFYNTCLSYFGGGGVYLGRTRNSIVVKNFTRQALAEDNHRWFSSDEFSYCCTTPLPPGIGNTNAALLPLRFLDVAYHLPVVSPVRGLGSSLYASGTDLDGESWANPPSIGADEVVDANLTGPLAVQIQVNAVEDALLPHRIIYLGAWIEGRAARLDWSFGDDGTATNTGFGVWHAWTNSGDYTLTATVYNNDSPGGVSTNVTVHILPIVQPNLTSSALSGNAFGFSFAGQEGVKYSIQYATNLAAPVTWHTMQLISYSSGGPNQISDSAWTNAARFYRVLAE